MPSCDSWVSRYTHVIRRWSVGGAGRSEVDKIGVLVGRPLTRWGTGSGGCFLYHPIFQYSGVIALTGQDKQLNALFSAIEQVIDLHA